MKFLMTVDVPDEMGDKVRALYVTVYNGFETRELNQKLIMKPMPRKRETVVRWVSQKFGNIFITHEPTEYDRGWNDCVKFLEGDDNG